MDEAWLDIMLSPKRMTQAGILGHEHKETKELHDSES